MSLSRERLSVCRYVYLRERREKQRAVCVWSSKYSTTAQSAFSDSVYHIYHSSLKIIANSCSSLLAKGFIFILAESRERTDEREVKNQVSSSAPAG